MHSSATGGSGGEGDVVGCMHPRELDLRPFGITFMQITLEWMTTITLAIVSHTMRVMHKAISFL